MSTMYTDNWKINTDTIYQETIIKPGDFAKIGQEEGFWVEIIKILPENQFLGKISNELIIKKDYKYGDLVSFHRGNIMDFKSSKTVIISNTDYVFYRGLASRK